MSLPSATIRAYPGTTRKCSSTPCVICGAILARSSLIPNELTACFSPRISHGADFAGRCDDCCHISKGAAALAEYEHIAQVKASLFKLDPYHLLFGTAACDDIWLWTEEGAGLGIDVVMKEAYGRSTASCGDLWGNASIPSDNRCEGGWSPSGLSTGLLRSHPMLFAPTQNMPSPGALGAARKVRSHAYAGVISEGTISNNFYVYNNYQHELWQLNAMVEQFSAEVSELLPSFLSAQHYGAGANELPQAAAEPVSLSSALASSEAIIMAGVWVEPGVADGSRAPCGHVIVVNTGNRPTAFRLQLTQLPVRLAATNASDGDHIGMLLPLHRIFDGQCVVGSRSGDDACSAAMPTAAYSLQAEVTRHLSLNSTVFNASTMDIVDNQATNIYRIGCELRNRAEPDGAPLVADGGFESVSLALPTHYYAGAGGGGGSHGGWRPAVGNKTDDRVRLRLCAAAPHAGRYAGRLQLPTAAVVALPVPLSGPTPPASAGDFSLTFFARSSPPGVTVHMGTENVSLGVAWAQINSSWSPPSADEIGRPVNGPVLQFSSPFSTGATVWIDSVALAP
eukprot:COSAG01_NODE_246_length_20450_cov_195.166822_3_plen_566_part_00